MALTKNSIDDLSYNTDGPSRQLVWDTQKGSGGVVGFGVRVYPSGSKAFIIGYRMTPNGKYKMYTIGQYPTWTLQQARKRAKELLVEIDHGKDPQSPIEADKHQTLEEYVERYLTDLRAEGKSTVGADQRRIYKWLVYHPELSPHICTEPVLNPKTGKTEPCNKVQKQSLGPCNKRGCNGTTKPHGKKQTLGKVPLREITTPMVDKALKKQGQIAVQATDPEGKPMVDDNGDPILKGKIEANRTIELLRRILQRSTASVEGMKQHIRVNGNPCTDVKLYKESSRDRYLSDTELVDLLRALEGEHDWLRGAVLFYLHSGLRKMELMSLPWSAIQLNSPEGAYLDVEQTKNGRKLKLALTEPMIELLYNVIPRTSEKWVFPSPQKAGEHLADFKRHWERIRENAKLKDVTIHDLRRTTGSIMASAGVSLHHIGEVLNHSNPEVTKIYARLSRDSQRESLETVADKLNEKLGGLRLEA